jgi:Tfp pilus assembly protein PilO
MKAEDVALNSEFFYNLERQTGVIFQRFSQGEATEGQGLNMSVNELRHFSVIPYDISLTGNLEAILGFVDALDRQSFIIRMESLNLNRAQDLQADSSLLNGRIRCHVLARKHE